MSLRRISDLSKANIFNRTSNQVISPEKVASMLFEVSYPGAGSTEGTWMSKACTYDDLSNALLAHIFDWIQNGDAIDLSGNFYFNQYRGNPSLRDTYQSKLYFKKFFAGSTHAGIFLDNDSSGIANIIASSKISLRVGTTNVTTDQVYSNNQGFEVAYAQAATSAFVAPKLSSTNLSVTNLTAATQIKLGNTIINSTGVNTTNVSASTQITVGTGTTKTTIIGGKVTAATFEGTATKAMWADLAEYYIADKEYEPGTLVKFGGKYEITEAASDDEVNAVVTSKPGFLLNNNIGISSYEQHPVAIALVGRTPVKVVGKVKKFQNLMMSDVPGIAIASDNTRKTVGKALADKDTADVGLVECVVKLEL